MACVGEIYTYVGKVSNGILLISSSMKRVSRVITERKVWGIVYGPKCNFLHFKVKLSTLGG